MLPTALVAAALKPSMTRRELESARRRHSSTARRPRRANMGVTDAREAVDWAAPAFEDRGILVVERGRFRVRERNVLRYYAKGIEHLLPAAAGRTH